MKKLRTPWTARNKMMDFIARREHSEKELRKKLKNYEFSESEVEAAIEYGKERGWIPDTPESMTALSERSGQYLARRGKGIRFINNKLREKGLPPVKASHDEELNKAFALVKTKYSKLDLKDSKRSREEKAKLKAKVARFLASRGFEMSIIREVIHEEF